MTKGKGKEQTSGTPPVTDGALDVLFQLPLAEFIAFRNALAVRLKKAGRGDEAARVKALPKPPVSAWAVNQLYWKHQQAFGRLIEAGERVRKLHTHQGKVDMRASLDARRESISDLVRLASALLSEAGHNPSTETMRRVSTTLEALSASAPSGELVPGRLTTDAEPPGFESLAAMIPSTGGLSAVVEAPTMAAERAVHEQQKRVQDLTAIVQKATDDAHEAEKEKREAEELVEKTSARLERARQRLLAVTAELQKAANSLADAERFLADRQRLKPQRH